MIPKQPLPSFQFAHGSFPRPSQKYRRYSDGRGPSVRCVGPTQNVYCKAVQKPVSHTEGHFETCLVGQDGTAGI